MDLEALACLYGIFIVYFLMVIKCTNGKSINMLDDFDLKELSLDGKKQFAVAYVRTQNKIEKSNHLEPQKVEIKRYIRQLRDYKLVAVFEERYRLKKRQYHELPELDKALSLTKDLKAKFFYINFSNSRQNPVVNSKIQDFQSKNKTLGHFIEPVPPGKIGAMLQGHFTDKETLSDEAVALIKHWQEKYGIGTNRIKNLEHYFSRISYNSPLILGVYMKHLREKERLSFPAIKEYLDAKGLRTSEEKGWEAKNISYVLKLWESPQFNNYKKVRNACRRYRNDFLAAKIFVDTVPMGQSMGGETFQ